MDIVKLFQDYNIQAHTEGHKHCRPGWINTECCFCQGNEGLHLGFCIEENYFTCWRCGGQPINKTVAKLLGISINEAISILSEYGGTRRRVASQDHKVRIKKRKDFELPSNTGILLARHKRYLIKRGYDPEKLEMEWGLLSTGPTSLLDKKDYKHRIVAPIKWDDKVVSFQARDVTDKSNLKYKACPKDRELILHQNILYGNQNKWSDTCICVEGITDVWRFGIEWSFGLFGITYTGFQVREIVKHFKRVPVAFDDDPQAIVQAKKLIAELRFRGVDSWFVSIVGDPGNMKQVEADKLVESIIK